MRGRRPAVHRRRSPRRDHERRGRARAPEDDDGCRHHGRAPPDHVEPRHRRRGDAAHRRADDRRHGFINVADPYRHPGDLCRGERRDAALAAPGAITAGDVSVDGDQR